jgi:replicative DNA helicase
MLPATIEAESALLGAIILDPQQLEACLQVVSPRQFFDEDLGKAFDVFLGMRQAGEPISDIAIVTSRLRASGVLEKIGGTPGIVKLTMATGSPDYAPFYAAEIKKAADLRRIQRLCEEALRRCQESKDPGQIAEWFNAQLRRQDSKLTSEKITENGRLLAEQYLTRLRAGETQGLITLPPLLSGIEIGKGLLTIIGAPPGAGKTAFVMQMAFDALRLDPSLTVTIANAETTFEGLLRREITRVTRIDSDRIRFGNLKPFELDAVERAVNDLLPMLDRIEIISDCNLGNLAKLIDRPPGLLIPDYLQKFSPPNCDPRLGVNQVMATMRTLAKAYWAVVCLSATTRTAKGHADTKELSLSSYRDSGEIEFNADSCYLLVDEGPLEKEYIRLMELRHVKNRHGAKVNRKLRFHMPRMTFEAHQSEPIRFGEFDEYEFEEDSHSERSTAGAYF